MANSNTVPVETVGVGDVVSLMYRDGDTTKTVRGKVGSIERAGLSRNILSADGVFMACYNVNAPRKVSAVMHERYNDAPTLFDFTDTLDLVRERTK